jgi:hypothetical protein
MPTYRAGQGITRFELEPSHSNGFMVRLCRDGNRVNEFFSDKKHGGTRKAKKAAESRYQQLVKKYGPAREKVTKDLMTHRNTSGHVGVHLAYSVSKQWSNSEYYAYCASWILDDGTREKISFGFNRYGEELAYTMACYARKHTTKDRAKVETKFKTDIEAYQKKKKRPKPSVDGAVKSKSVTAKKKVAPAAIKKAKAPAKKAKKAAKR